jgi:hypothetical protein
MSDNAQGGGIPSGESAAPESAQFDNSIDSGEGQGESGELSAESLQDAVESGELSQKEAQKLIKKYSLKVRGQTIEREVDLSDDEFIKNQLQLAEVSKLSMQQAAEIKKAYEKEMQRLRSNPWEMLQELGLDGDALAEERIQRRIEEMKKSPEQLEKEKYQRELEEARAEAKKLKEERDNIEAQKLQEQAAIQINDEIDKALNGHKSLPNSPMVRRRIADTMLWAMENGHPEVSAEDVVPLVQREMREELQRLYSEMPEEALEDFIGKQNIDRMRKKRLATTKVPGVNQVKPTTQSIKSQEPAKPAEKIPAKDFFRKNFKK